jgi:hypothetical protein
MLVPGMYVKPMKELLLRYLMEKLKRDKKLERFYLSKRLRSLLRRSLTITDMLRFAKADETLFDREGMIPVELTRFLSVAGATLRIALILTSRSV